MADYDLDVVAKELDGKRIELTYYHKEDKAILYQLYQALVCAMTLGTLNEALLTKKNVQYVINCFMGDIETTKLDRIHQLLKRNLKQVTQFDQKLLSDDTFYLDYQLYRQRKDMVHVSFEANISSLKTKYTKQAVDKNLNSHTLAASKLEATLSLLNIDLLKHLEAHETLDYYFLELNVALLDDKKSLVKILKLINHKQIMKHVVFLIDQNDYQNHKRIISYLAKQYILALNTNMAKIKDVKAKLTELETLDQFTYLLVSNLKSSDYDLVLKYRGSKIILINEYVRG